MVNHIYDPGTNATLCNTYGGSDAEAVSTWDWPHEGWADYKESRVSCPDCLGDAAELWATPGAVAHDPVNKPHHYRWHPITEKFDIECIDIASAFDYPLGNVIKYVWRCDYKGKPVEDLKKAVTYLQRAIEEREAKGE